MTLFAIHFLQDFEDLDEQVDDVQVEFDCGDDVFFRWHSFHDHLGVKENESWNIMFCYQNDFIDHIDSSIIFVMPLEYCSAISITWEEKCSKHCHQCICDLSSDKDLHEASKNQNPQSGEESFGWNEWGTLFHWIYTIWSILNQISYIKANKDYYELTHFPNE